jgi:phosphatidylglycerophosphatase A
MSAPNPTATTSSAPRKPHLALAIATAFGLGYLPKAPGTWGSLGGVALAMYPFWLFAIPQAALGFVHSKGESRIDIDPLLPQISSIVAVALIGLWSAHRAARFWGIKDPQKIVIDEVSGQQITLLLGGLWWTQSGRFIYAHVDFSRFVSPNWKYLLLGFILFRAFDIWKPFPARQAESLPGGLGIMADDWIAGIYAALGLWIARALGL